MLLPLLDPLSERHPDREGRQEPHPCNQGKNTETLIGEELIMPRPLPVRSIWTRQETQELVLYGSALAYIERALQPDFEEEG